MAKRHLSGRQLRFLFARGILRGKGSGKNRTVSYDKKRAKTTSNLRKRGVDVTSRKRYRNTPGNSGRHVFGAKAAHLRGSGTGGKVNHSATRAARIAAAQSVVLRGTNITAGSARRIFQDSKTNPELRAGKVAAVQKIIDSRAKISGDKLAEQRLNKLAQQIGKSHTRDAAHSQNRMRVSSGTGGKPKVDHSATRVARIAAGHRQWGEFVIGLKHRPSMTENARMRVMSNVGELKGYNRETRLGEMRHNPKSPYYKERQRILSDIRGSIATGQDVEAIRRYARHENIRADIRSGKYDALGNAMYGKTGLHGTRAPRKRNRR